MTKWRDKWTTMRPELNAERLSRVRHMTVMEIPAVSLKAFRNPSTARPCSCRGLDFVSPQSVMNVVTTPLRL